MEILGCQFNFFKEHIENQFDNNMNWENYGSSSTTEDELLKLNHYTNFQPLYWLDNLHKHDHFISQPTGSSDKSFSK
jgi:hypothetical protein